MNGIEEQFRSCILKLQEDYHWNDAAWDTFQLIIKQQYVLSESFLREMKDILTTSIFIQLISNQQLSLDFARELDII